MYKFKEYVMLIILVIASFFSIISFIPLKEVVETNTWIEDYVLIAAHRGGAYLNPENTQKAFDYVIKETSYTDIVEIDVRLTKDNILVINHDGDINRMGTNENEEEIKISAHTYEELSNYNLGKNFVDLNGNKPYYDLSIDEARQEGLTIMKFEDFLIRYNDYENVKVFIEIKDSGDGAITIADMIISMLDKYSSYKNRSMIISFDDEVLDYIYKTYPNQYTGALGDKVVSQIALNKLCLDAFSSPNYHSIQVKN